MAEKQKRVTNHSSLPPTMDELNQHFDLHCRRLHSNSSDHLPSSTESTRTRRCPPIANEQIDFFIDHPHSIYNHHLLPSSTPTSTASRKRFLEDDSHIQSPDFHAKRTRCEHHIELENQPPSTAIKRRSVLLYHAGQDWNHLQMTNERPTFYNPLLPSLSTPHEYEQSLSNQYTPSSIHNEYLANQHLHMFENETSFTTDPKNTIPKSTKTMVTSNNVRLFSPQSNVFSPLRTTNFVLDSKQQTMSATIMRTGNISPAHSDTSTESTSTCSSDEQQFRWNFPSFHYQPSRSYRERENYEQLLDLAEKLSDPNRFKSVDIEHFASYRYRSIRTTDLLSSKQTACVICMSHFKDNQRIRILPCQHEYHSKCIAKWFTMNSSCPICRRDNFLSNH
ncbi:unnamed protein product [Adineta ricciae]|uniref:RING-type domain-containing protein n=2 Tax=Adineta ricciae TaxID=249248 RepID=A0A816AXB1_ADIRI|nr:unnamed protein product [Adineta ricciae]